MSDDREVDGLNFVIEELLELAARDSDLASMFVLGESCDETKGAIIIIKGKDTTEVVRDTFAHLGLLTIGKPNADLKDPAWSPTQTMAFWGLQPGASFGDPEAEYHGEVSLPPFTVEDPGTGAKVHHETEAQRITREVAAEIREMIEKCLREAEKDTFLHIGREVYHLETATAVMREFRATFARHELAVPDESSDSDGLKGGIQG